jgi:hypothetical protein
VLIGCWQRHAGILTTGFWWVVLFLATNPHFLGLPGSGVITNFAVVIGAYLFFSIFAGYVPGRLADHWARNRPLVGWSLSLVMVVLGLWGALGQLRIIDSSSIYVTTSDLRAMAWIKAQLPADARFVVNSQLANAGSVVVGTDGGWWLPLLAGRQNTTPPFLYVTEAPPYPGYVQTISDIHQLVHQPDQRPAQLAKEMLARDLGYVYIGQRRGQVGAGDEPPLDPAWFSASGAFKLIYSEDGVRIFQVDPAGVDSQ